MFACLCRDLIELAFQWAPPTMQRKTHGIRMNLKGSLRPASGVVSQVLRLEMWTWAKTDRFIKNRKEPHCRSG